MLWKQNIQMELLEKRYVYCKWKDIIKMKRIVSYILSMSMLLSVLLAFTGCGGNADENVKENNETETTQVVTDMKGNEVTVPTKVDRYVVLWKSFGTVVALLDSCDGLVAIDYDQTKDSDAWLFEICPNAVDISKASEEMTAEEIIALDVDVVFWQSSKCEELATQLNELGVAAVNVDYTDYESMKKSITLTAQVLNTDYAKTMAEKYNAELDMTLAEIKEKTDTIADESKVSIINLRTLETLRADGKNTVADTWIYACGAKNLVSEQKLEGNQYLTSEQFFEWNPDYIISSAVGDDDILLTDAKYSSLTAVKEGHVYTNPQGIFWWNRYSVETILQLKWATSILYPELFTDVDIHSEVENFYKEFFNYEISDEDVDNMLNAAPPASK